MAAWTPKSFTSIRNEGAADQRIMQHRANQVKCRGGSSFSRPTAASVWFMLPHRQARDCFRRCLFNIEHKAELRA